MSEGSERVRGEGDHQQEVVEIITHMVSSMSSPAACADNANMYHISCETSEPRSCEYNTMCVLGDYYTNQLFICRSLLVEWRSCPVDVCIPQQLPSFFRLVNIAGMEIPVLIGSFAQSLMELKLDDEADKVPD